MTENIKTRITKADLPNIEVHGSPAVLFDTINLAKELCDHTKSDYTILLNLLGLGDKKPVKKPVNGNEFENTLQSIILNVATFLFKEYDAVNRQPGPYLKRILNILSEATEHPYEVLQKTDFKILLKLLICIIKEPENELQSSFLGVNPSS